MGKFVEHLKRKAESAGCEVIELNAYKLKMSQYDPQTDAYRKKPLKERWHRWGNTGTLVLLCLQTGELQLRALLYMWLLVLLSCEKASSCLRPSAICSNS